uniref:Uncharacterized protein n=1 Tax=Anguilla anguilla TaxID=7936 RepID=A0A0E9P7Y5_ANGAN
MQDTSSVSEPRIACSPLISVRIKFLS